jgi:type I restriction enzyme R subunit
MAKPLARSKLSLPALLTGVEEQSESTSKGAFGLPPGARPAFLFDPPAAQTRFTNRLDPVPRSRNVFAFHRPETLLAWVESDAPPQAASTIGDYATRKGNFLSRIQHMPPLIDDIWPPKPQAIMNLEQSCATTARARSCRWLPAPAKRCSRLY